MLSRTSRKPIGAGAAQIGRFASSVTASSNAVQGASRPRSASPGPRPAGGLLDQLMATAVVAANSGRPGRDILLWGALAVALSVLHAAALRAYSNVSWALGQDRLKQADGVSRWAVEYARRRCPAVSLDRGELPLREPHHLYVWGSGTRCSHEQKGSSIRPSSSRAQLSMLDVVYTILARGVGSARAWFEQLASGAKPGSARRSPPLVQ